MNWSLAIATVVLGYLVHWAWCLGRNYLAARSWGVPVLVCPLDPDAVPYVIIKVPLRPLLKALLPASVYESFQVSIFGWEFLDKGKLHQTIGSSFAYVTPRVNELWTSDPVMAHEMLSRRKDFRQLRMSQVIMGVLGPNIISSDGDSWTRQRRLVAPNVNERIMKVVWDESHSQAAQMASRLLSHPGGVSSETIPGLRTIAINVIGLAGYGQSRPWTPEALHPSQKEDLSYFDAIYLVMLNLVPAVFLSPRLLQLPFMPESVRLTGKAKQSLPEFTRAMLEDERRSAQSSAKPWQQQSQNFMTMLLKFSDPSADLSGSQYLSDDEIQGNLFVFTIAGFDTTSNAMAYAVAMLAARPQWQEWLQEELDDVIPDPSEMGEYESSYPRLMRCLSIMYETLRLFPPVIHVGKQSSTPQSINSKAGAHHVTPGIIYVNAVALHRDPDIWGPDADEFRPSRWIVDGPNGEPQFFTPPRGSYMPWSSGPRVCPGQKMSTVEFASAMGTLFRSCSVEPALVGGKSIHEMRKRLLEITDDSQSRVTLQMNRPEDVILKWTKRV